MPDLRPAHEVLLDRIEHHWKELGLLLQRSMDDADACHALACDMRAMLVVELTEEVLAQMVVPAAERQKVSERLEAANRLFVVPERYTSSPHFAWASDALLETAQRLS